MVRVLQETFSERWLVQEGQSSAIFHISKILASSPQELGTVECAYSITQLPKVEVVCPIILVELILTVVWWIIGEFSLWNGILENSLTLWNFKAGKPTSELGFVYDQPILRSLCSGSKKLRLPHQLTILWHRDRLESSLIFLISICFMRWLRQPWRSISARSQTSE